MIPPLPRIGLDEVREDGLAGPNLSNVRRSVGIADPVLLRGTFLIDAISWIDFDARVDDGHDLKARLSQVGNHAGKVWESFFVPSKGSVAVHVANIQIQRIAGDLLFAKGSGCFANVRLGKVAVSALMVA